MIGQIVTWICLDFGDPYLYFDVDRFHLPTPITCKSGGFEKKSPEKPVE